MDQREIKIRYCYTNGTSWIFRDFTLLEIENGFPFEVLSDNPLLKAYYLRYRVQSTGLFDKNGIEIFEGDHFGSKSLPVYFMDGSFVLGGLPLRGYLTGAYMEKLDCIKGNIFQINP